MADFNALRNRVAETKPGTDAAVGIVRDGSDKTLTVKLDEVAANRSARGSSGSGPQADDKTALGVAVEPLTPAMAARAGVGRGVKGLLVENVDPDGRAADAGIQAGDVIVEANRKAVDSVDDLRTAARSTADKPLLLLVHRQGRELFVTVRPHRAVLGLPLRRGRRGSRGGRGQRAEGRILGALPSTSLSLAFLRSAPLPSAASASLLPLRPRLL